MGEAEAEALDCMEGNALAVELVGWDSTPVAPRVTKGGSEDVRDLLVNRAEASSASSLFPSYHFLLLRDARRTALAVPVFDLPSGSPRGSTKTTLCLGAVGKVPGRVGSLWEGQPNQRRLGIGTLGSMT